MLSPVDMLVIGGIGLLLFGPDQLPKVMRKVGGVVRDVQLTSQSFIREMERAADDTDAAAYAAQPPVEHFADPTPAPHPFAEEILPDSARTDDFADAKFEAFEPKNAPADDGLKD